MHVCEVTHDDVCPVQPSSLMGTSYTLKGEPSRFQIALSQPLQAMGPSFRTREAVQYIAVCCHTHQESLNTQRYGAPMSCECMDTA